MASLADDPNVALLIQLQSQITALQVKLSQSQAAEKSAQCTVATLVRIIQEQSILPHVTPARRADPTPEPLGNRTFEQLCLQLDVVREKQKRLESQLQSASAACNVQGPRNAHETYAKRQNNGGKAVMQYH